MRGRFRAVRKGHLDFPLEPLDRAQVFPDGVEVHLRHLGVAQGSVQHQAAFDQSHLFLLERVEIGLVLRVSEEDVPCGFFGMYNLADAVCFAGGKKNQTPAPVAATTKAATIPLRSHRRGAGWPWGSVTGRTTSISLLPLE